MENVKRYFSTEPAHLAKAQDVKLSEESLISTINSFFTDNINYLITACLVYFTLFTGFTRMKQKHLMVAVPGAAIWTVLQAKALVGTLAAGTAVLGLAKAYFAWQGTNNPVETAANTVSSLASMTQRFTGESGRTQGVASVVAEQVFNHQRQPTQPVVPTPRVQGVVQTAIEQARSIGEHSPAVPSVAKRTTSLFENVDQAVEDYQQFTSGGTSPSSSLGHGFVKDLDLDGSGYPQDLMGMYEEALVDEPPFSAPSSSSGEMLGMQQHGNDLDRLLDDALDEFDAPLPHPAAPSNGFSIDSTVEQLQSSAKALEIPGLSLEQTREFEGIWNKASSQTIPRETHEMFEGIWQQGLKQAPKGANAEDWAAEFVLREGKKKGMSMGQCAKIAVGCLAVAGLGYAAYKLWKASSEEPAEAENREKVQDLALEKDFEEDEESGYGVLGFLGSALGALVPDEDTYYPDYDSKPLFGGFSGAYHV